MKYVIVMVSEEDVTSVFGPFDAEHLAEAWLDGWDSTYESAEVHALESP